MICLNKVSILINGVWKSENLTKKEVLNVWTKKLLNVKISDTDAILVGIKEKNDQIFLEVFITSDSSRKGNLFVPNSYSDSIVISNILSNQWEDFDEIIISRDCHKKEHISHKKFWIAGPGASDIFHYENKSLLDILHPANFQIITYQDVLKKIWIPSNLDYYSYCLYYTYELEAHNKYLHCIWNDHCVVNKNFDEHNSLFYICENTYTYDLLDQKIIKTKSPILDISDSFILNYDDFGYKDLCYNLTDYSDGLTLGHDLMYNVKKSLFEWKQNWLTKYGINKKIDFVDIGFNIFTESYNIFLSETQDYGDPLTGLNTKLIEKLNIPNSKLYITGEALNYCVKSSIENLLQIYKNPIKNITLVINATSPIQNKDYKNLVDNFFNEIKSNGVVLANYINGKFEISKK